MDSAGKVVLLDEEKVMDENLVMLPRDVHHPFHTARTSGFRTP